jgi:very-short-patch-repair endonuclease
MKPRIPLPAPLDSGPFTVRSAIEAGLGQKRLRGVDLEVPFSGVRTAGERRVESPYSRTTTSSNVAGARESAGRARTTDSREQISQLYRALQTKLPQIAYACGPTAALIMGVPLPARLQRSSSVHVAVPPAARTLVGRGIRGHTLESIGDTPRDWNGLRVSSPEQLWCELAPVLSLTELVAAGDYLIHWRQPLTTVTQLAAAVTGFAGHRGVRKLRMALALLNDRAESPKESELRVIVVLAGITGLEVNLSITTTGGFTYRGDIAFPRQMVLIEYQGDHHRDPETFRRDMTRASRLEADGWYILNLNANDLHNADELTARIRRILRSRPHR